MEASTTGNRDTGKGNGLVAFSSEPDLIMNLILILCCIAVNVFGNGLFWHPFEAIFSAFVLQFAVLNAESRRLTLLFFVNTLPIFEIRFALEIPAWKGDFCLWISQKHTFRMPKNGFETGKSSARANRPFLSRKSKFDSHWNSKYESDFLAGRVVRGCMMSKMWKV